MQFKAEDIEVVNNEAAARFEASVAGETAYLTYEHQPGRIIYDHAKVPTVLEGHGLAGKITKTALDYARANGLKVVPVCPYVAAYIRKHPEYQDLVTTGS
jgi:predicted GNAT family acetyltransferase